MHNVYLFYPQYQDGVEPYIIQWLPYSVCAVWSYVETFDDINNKFTVKDIVFKREPYEDIVARIDNPSVCLFSNYVWNEQYNIGLAKAIKKQYPNALIVFGGPQVYNQGELFLEEFPIVDVVITNEGEYKLLEFLRDFADKKHKRIYSSSQRVTLTDLVSPYVDSNIMNWVIEQNPDVKWAMVMETNRGCPFSCTFCDWGGLTQSKIKRFNLEKVFQEIDWLCDNRIEYLYIADANFGALYERDLEIAKYFAKKKRETGYPYVINVNWYKNATEKVLNLNKILNDAGLNRGMTLSVQSLNDSTLDAIERKNMEMSNLGEMYRRCNEQGLKFYTEFIMGLPNETLASFKHGVCRSIELGCHNAIDCYPLDILRNSELYQQRDTHGFTIKTYKNIMPNQPTDVYEYNNYVIATNTMTRNDIVEAWLWLYIVFNAHHYGWTQILQKFSYKHLGITAETFYTNYFHDVIMKNDFLRTRYYRTKEKLVEIFYDSNNEAILKDNDIPYYGRQHEWHDNRDLIYNDIDNWARDFFYKRYGVKKDLIEDVVKLNRHYNVNKYFTDSFTVEYNYNIFEYCEHQDTKLKKSKTTYQISNRMPWKDDADFNQLIYRRARHGFNIRDFKRIEA